MLNNYYSTKLVIKESLLEKNINFFKSKIPLGTKIIAVIKANAYGYGDLEMACRLLTHNIAYLAVADFEEGIRLRKHNIKSPIMVLYPSKNNLDIIIENNLEPTIFSESMLDLILQKSEKTIKIHIKIDSGMGRYGIMEDRIRPVIKKIKGSKNIKIASIFSHLSSNSKEHRVFSNKQIDYFNKVRDLFSKQFVYKIDSHILSSYGLVNFQIQPHNMVRIGFGLYNGLDGHKLNHIGELYSQISQIKYLKKGNSVGYNRSFIARKKTKIGIIPLGYADGLQRSWGKGRLKFLYNNQFVPVLGEISMDSCVVDITNVNNAKEGDTVILFGDKRPIFDLAKELKTIPYEITAGLSKRIKRVFIN